jgi:quinol monooxygenase YgiN
MTTLFLVASLTAKSGREAELKQVLLDLRGPSRADDGCLQYDLHADRENPRHFLFFEAWRDEKSWRAHMETPHLKDFNARSGDLLENWMLHQLDRL